MSLNFKERIGRLSKPIIATLTAGYLLTGCGGGGGGGGGGEIPSESTSKEKYIGYVQAGYVKGAKVYVEGPNGEILYQTTTNENGEYEIDKEKLETNLKDYGYDMSTVLKIYTEGGIDTDTNDDGIKGDESAVKASLSAVFQYPDINNSRITPISTLVTSYLLEVLNQQPTIDKLNEVSKKLGFSSYNEVLHYDMVKQDSDIEDKLRENYFIDYLHKGYFENGKNKEENIKKLVEDETYEVVEPNYDEIIEELKEKLSKLRKTDESISETYEELVDKVNYLKGYLPKKCVNKKAGKVLREV